MLRVCLLATGVVLLGITGRAEEFSSAGASLESVSLDFLQSPSGGASPRLAQGQAPSVDPQLIQQLIRQLGAESFRQREAAMQRLRAIGEPALIPLRRAAREYPDPEVRQRAARLIRLLENSLLVQLQQMRHAAGRLPWVTRVAVTPDGRRAVSAGLDALRLWDLSSGQEIRAFGQNAAGYWALAFSRDGRRLIAGSGDGSAYVFDLEKGQLLQRLQGHKGEVWGAALSADGTRAVTGAWDRSLRTWDVTQGKELGVFKDVADSVRCLALSPDGKWVAAGHFRAEKAPAVVRLWQWSTGRQVRVFTGHAQEVTSVAFSPDGKHLASSSFDGSVRLWNVATGQEERRFKGHASRVEYVAFTPDGQHLVSCGDEADPTVRLWDIASGEQVFQSPPVGAGFLCIAVLPNGRQWLTTGKDGVLRWWRWGP